MKKNIQTILVGLGLMLASEFPAEAYYNDNAHKQYVYDSLSNMEIPLVVMTILRRSASLMLA